MPCACQNKRQTYEVVPNAGAARRAVFTSSSIGTAEAVADRYPMSVVRDKKTGYAVYFAWPKGSYEVALNDGGGSVIVASTAVRDARDRAPLKAAADAHAAEQAVVRVAGGGVVVYPLPNALTASGSTLTAAASVGAAGA